MAVIRASCGSSLVYGLVFWCQGVNQAGRCGEHREVRLGFRTVVRLSLFGSSMDTQVTHHVTTRCGCFACVCKHIIIFLSVMCIRLHTYAVVSHIRSHITLQHSMPEGLYCYSNLHALMIIQIYMSDSIIRFRFRLCDLNDSLKLQQEKMASIFQNSCLLLVFCGDIDENVDISGCQWDFCFLFIELCTS